MDINLYENLKRKYTNLLLKRKIVRKKIQKHKIKNKNRIVIVNYKEN